MKVKIQNSQVVCPFCKYNCDATLSNGEYPSLVDDVCPHFRKVKHGVAYFYKKWRPNIKPFINLKSIN